MVRYNSKQVDITIYYKDGSTCKTTEWLSPKKPLNWLFSKLLITYPADFVDATHIEMTKDGKTKKFVI